ncbi:metal-dependent hydrolase [Mariniflexile litorale]|uniref:Metal-dependent hydrolase n=1 Tax=Mariniflexile litorale TaxID=3045158 RepID=A0AAU7EII3_9FLAO|nr:metal-dependent hydrolase [Mariniflexile sp. KMM 9835]MDQ8210265.1 metal-dependent hydrolase [Mariniflexile sp. KMM 9835]
MASIFGHSVVGFTLTKLIDTKHTKRLLLVAIFSTILPDFDVVSFQLGIPYLHLLGHRGFTHSLLFALLWAFVIMFTLGKQRKLIWFLVILFSTLSHGILDAMTSGGKGVGFFIPFDNNRFFFPFREIRVSPIGIEKFFSERGIQVLLSEFKYVIIPCFIILGVRFLIFKLKDRYYNEI